MSAVEIHVELSGAAVGQAFGAIPFSVLPGGASEPHSHSSEEYWIVIGGCGVVYTGFEAVPVSTGSRLFVRPGATHYVQNTGDSALDVLSFWWRSQVDGE